MDIFKLTIKNKKTIMLVNLFLYISFFICIIGILNLYIFNTYYISINLYKSGIIIFRTGLLAGVFSIMYGIFFENYLGC